MSVILIPDHIRQIDPNVDTNLFEKRVTILFKPNCCMSHLLFDTSIAYSYDIGRIPVDIHMFPMEIRAAAASPERPWAGFD